MFEKFLTQSEKESYTNLQHLQDIQQDLINTFLVNVIVCLSAKFNSSIFSKLGVSEIKLVALVLDYDDNGLTDGAYFDFKSSSKKFLQCYDYQYDADYSNQLRKYPEFYDAIDDISAALRYCPRVVSEQLMGYSLTSNLHYNIECIGGADLLEFYKSNCEKKLISSEIPQVSNSLKSSSIKI